MTLDIGSLCGIAIIFGLIMLLPGIAIGLIWGTQGQIKNILNLLRDFKAEGRDNKWLK